MPLIADFIGQRTPPDLYEEYLANQLFAPWADRLLERQSPSGHVLDIASGTGVVSRKLAASPATSQVDALDLAEPMVAKARSLGDGGGKIIYQAASAIDLPFGNDRFDAAYCQQGLQFFPDKVRALSEARRVLKPGATLAAAVWTFAPDGNPVLAAFEKIVADMLGQDLIPFGPFSFGSGAEIKETARQAGFADPFVERAELVTALPPVRTFVLFDLIFLGRPGDDGSLQPVFDPTDASKDGLIEEMIARLEKDVADLVQPDGSLLAPSAANFLIAEA